MGAWSHEPLGNDDASDWVGELIEANDVSLIDEALDAVLAIGGNYLEAPEASIGVAAAEVVARLQGNFGVQDAYSEALDSWVSELGITPTMTQIQKAISVLDRVVSDSSELVELWQDSDEFNSWSESIANLKSRIRG